ncbi:hypothetical protein FOZ63_021535, partial [Perkinsus olseni]
SIAVCRLGQAATITTANYLQLWQVKEAPIKHPTATVAALTAVTMRNRNEADGRALVDTRVKIPAPPGSALASWPEPSTAETHNLERYREAFVKENKLWLQHTFDEILRDQALVKYRGALLKSIAEVIGEVDPDKYNPFSESKAPIGQRPLPSK